MKQSGLSQTDKESYDTSAELLSFTTRRWNIYLNTFAFIQSRFESLTCQRSHIIQLWYNNFCFDFARNIMWSTGGRRTSSAEMKLWKVDIYRDISRIEMASLFVARSNHAGLYHQGCIYVFGGKDNQSILSSSERYSTSEDRWEFIESIPYACFNACAITLESTQSIYLFGGYGQCLNFYDSILRMELGRMTWEVLSMKLPKKCLANPACFKVDETQVYFVTNKGLYVYNSRSDIVSFIKSVESDYRVGSCYLFKRELYKINLYKQPVRSIQLGSLEANHENTL